MPAVFRFRILATCVLAAFSTASIHSEAFAQQVIPLWEGGAPGFEDRKDEPEEAESYWVKNVHNPTLTAFLPEKDKATGAAVVIAPGGGHRLLVFNAEGVEAAKYLQSIGVAAFALKYRLGREEGSPYEIDVHGKQDGLRAIELVRERADEFGIDPQRVGVMGFSAGGEVASMVSYAKDPEVRPNFQILIYPGPLGIPESIPQEAPPAFLLVANDDRGASRVIVDLLPKLRKAEVPVEAHVYARGGHAFNMGNRTELVTLKKWRERLHEWLLDNAILDPNRDIKK